MNLAVMLTFRKYTLYDLIFNGVAGKFNSINPSGWVVWVFIFYLCLLEESEIDASLIGLYIRWIYTRYYVYLLVTCKAKGNKNQIQNRRKIITFDINITVMDLQTRKLNLIEYLIGIQDEKIFQRIEDSINKTLQTTNQPLRQFTQQELTDRALKSNEDYHLGKFQDQEKLEKESNYW